MKRLLMAMVLAGASVAMAADYPAELNQVLSKLQSMGHGSYTQAEWNEALGSLDRLSSKAEQAGDWNGVIEAGVIKAMVFSDMRRDYSSALSALDDLKTRFGKVKLPAMKKVYVREAQTYSQMGDESAIQRVMQEFQASPNYDPEFYSYSVGEGRNTPVTMVRPSAGSAGSVSVMAMNVAKQQSQFSPGAAFPSFRVTDASGRTWTSEDLRGKVYLVDFWARDWTPWKRDLDNLRSFYARYHTSGFEVIGVNLDANSGDLNSFAQAQRIAWPLAPLDRNLTKDLGIFGDCTNYLVDQNGVIVGRNLRGADLIAAAKRALGAR